MNRDTLEVALVEVNRRRAHHRRAHAELERTQALSEKPWQTRTALERHEAELVRLEAAHRELAAELELAKAREVAEAAADRHGIPLGQPIPIAGGGTLTVELAAAELERRKAVEQFANVAAGLVGRLEPVVGRRAPRIVLDHETPPRYDR